MLVFDTVISPPELLARVPLICRLMPSRFDITSVVPDRTTSSSPTTTITLPELRIVHVLVEPSHVPPYVGHEVPSSVMVAAFASWLNDNNPKTKTEAIARIDITLTPSTRLFSFDVI